MKLISYNIGIKIDNADLIAAYLESESPDFVALQEVIHPLDDGVFPMYRSKEVIDGVLSKELPHTTFGPLWTSNGFRKHGEMHRDFGGYIEQGNELLSKFPIIESRNEFYYQDYADIEDWTHFRTVDHPRAVLISTIDIGGKALQILNLHGIWNESRMGDARTLHQCQYVLDRALKRDVATIIVGDFNLIPESEGIKLLSKTFTNLIELYDIRRTRPPFQDTLESGATRVDYIFTNDQIQVQNFSVPEIPYSDHYPLLLEFEITESF